MQSHCVTFLRCLYNSEADTVSSQPLYNSEADTVSSQPLYNSDTISFGSPFIVLTEGGCSGTTAVGRYIRLIASMHGHYKAKHVTFEFLNADQYNPRIDKYKNRYYHDIVMERDMTKEEEIENQTDLIIKSIERAQEVAIESESLIFFKASTEQYQKLHSRLRHLKGGVSYAGLYRENILDRCTCMVRDCFREVKQFGFSVFGANGAETDLCFDRRQHPEVDVQAYFTNVKGCLAEDKKRVHYICDKGFDCFSTDVLFLFEKSMDDKEFEISVDAWMDFLKPLLNDELERELVASALEEGRGTRTKPSSQESKVYNYEQVKEQLLGDMNFEGFLND